MSEASIRAGDGAGELLLSGVLDHVTGPALREQGRALIRAATSPSILIDCAGVQRSTSVGVALVLAYMRDAQQAGKTLHLRNLPHDLCQIAHVSDVTELLPVEG